MAKKSKKNSLLASRFYRVYFAAVAAALVAIAIGLVWLNGLVKDYEISQPVHAAEQVAKLFEDGDYARLYGLDAAAAELSGGDEAFYVKSLTELAAGKSVTWREAYSADPDEKKYTVFLDGDRLAGFTLVPSGETTGHGNRLWTLGSVATNVALGGAAAQAAQAAPEQSAPQAGSYATITVPAGYGVTVDGVALTEADAARTGIPVLPENFLPAGVEAPTLTEYGFYAAGEPAIAVTDPSGAPVEAVPAGENAWQCPYPENAQLKEQFGEAIVKLAQRVAEYTVDDLSRSGVLKYVAGDSPAEDILRHFSNSWAPPHKTSAVSDAKVSEVYVLGEDCFTCHVEFTFTLTTRRGNDYVYPTAYTFCVVKRKGMGLLYNITFN